MEPVMDELMISGKRFVSSRRAAKEYHYHSDYIGQLIRSNKIVGQKVGHNWYVSASSLAAYMRKKDGEENEDPKKDDLKKIQEVQTVETSESTIDEITEEKNIPEGESKSEPEQMRQSLNSKEEIFDSISDAEKTKIDYKMMKYLPQEEAPKSESHEHASGASVENQIIPIRIAKSSIDEMETHTIDTRDSDRLQTEPQGRALSKRSSQMSVRNKIVLTIIFAAVAVAAAGGSFTASMLPSQLTATVVDTH
jgi:hypothetical protein